MTGQRIWPSAVNALEILRFENQRKRQRLLQVIDALKGKNPLLPWPLEVADKVARALAERRRSFSASATWLDQLVHSPQLVTREHVEFAKDFLDGFEVRFRSAVDRTRPQVLAEIRTFQLQHGTAPTAEELFHRFWSKPSNLTRYAALQLATLKLTGRVSPSRLQADHHWRLLTEAFGLAALRQVVRKQRPGWVERADLAQLVYMADADLLISGDKDFVRAAGEILHGRYPMKQAILFEDYLAAC
jgi:hypothetical protein